MHDKIPLVDLKAQYASVRADVDRAMQGVLDATSFIMGPEVAHFEAAFGAWCGAPHCVGVSSGTAALELALRALGVGMGDSVITVAHTFIATAESISAVGATPVFVDIDPVTYTMDPAALADALSPAVRAIIPVHIYGYPADMAAINALAEARNVAVIEDAAQAHGATVGGVRAGTLATLACFSFYPGKNLGAYGDAGAVTTRDAGLAEKVRLLRNHGRRAKYVHDIVGFGERLDTLQAAVLLAKLPYLDRWTDARRRLAARYNAHLAQMEQIVLPQCAPGVDPAWHLYVIRAARRDALLEHMRAQGVEAGVHYPLPLHLQPAYASLGGKRGALPVTEAVADSCLSLPLYPEMTHAQQDRVVESVRTFYEGRG